MSNELHEVKRLEHIVNDIANYKSDMLCGVSEEELEEAITTMMNVCLVLLDRGMHMYPLFSDWPVVRAVYHGRLTAEEAVKKNY
ncbi:MAG TPA: hypothetical protein PKD68_00435 [Candidatus Saccharibacteria bacterium]|nr:hypothetical protein [Candidatus Saccharibacteria bacterium]